MKNKILGKRSKEEKARGTRARSPLGQTRGVTRAYSPLNRYDSSPFSPAPTKRTRVNKEKLVPFVPVYKDKIKRARVGKKNN